MSKCKSFQILVLVVVLILVVLLFSVLVAVGLCGARFCNCILEMHI